MANNQSQQNPQSSLDEAIVAAAKRACGNLTTWHNGGLCPDRDDLTGVVLLKLCAPAIRPILEKIWTDPDSGGFTGLLKFVRTVSKRTLIDEVRRLAAETRNPEGGMVSLDEPIRSEDCETGTQADLISDADGMFQAFQFDDLRDQLTDEEFTVLYGIVANRATEQELSQEIGTSDSTVSRTYKRAREKAQKWICWLRDRTYKQARAHIYPTFTRRPCLRPDGIARKALEHWNALNVVPFHNPASDWRPPITTQPRVRAKRECWNAACQNGLAIGSDNLVLPESRRREAIRFLPAYTGTDNRLCEGCKEAEKRAEVLQTASDTKTARLIERAELNTTAIPSRESFADAQQYDSSKQASTFFSPTGLSNSEDATQGNRMMDYKEAAETIKHFNIPRNVVARLSGMHLPDISAWLGGKICRKPTMLKHR